MRCSSDRTPGEPRRLLTAAPNHVLPTGGQARFGAGLSASTFLRPQQVVRYTATALAEVVPHIVALSTEEQLPAHGAAVSERTNR